MNRLATFSRVLVLLCGALSAAFAEPPVIGTATGRGQFYLDSATVQGNATLLDGSVVETRTTPSLLRLQGGPRMTIGSASRGRVYGDRLVLEKGEGRLEGSRQYRIEAGSLQVLPDSGDSAAQVALAQPGRVSVAALSGAVRVVTANGVLLAKLETGTALEFEPQAAGATPPLSLSGCLTAVNGLFRLRDETSNLNFELKGQELGRYAGQRVALTATALRDARPVTAGAQVIQVTQVKPLGGGCSPTAPAAAKGGKGAPASPKPATATGTSKAVIAGVAIAAVAGGTALGLTGEEDGGQTISR